MSDRVAMMPSSAGREILVHPIVRAANFPFHAQGRSQIYWRDPEFMIAESMLAKIKRAKLVLSGCQ